MKNRIQSFQKFLYWSWNIIFLVVVYMGLLPTIGVEVIASLFASKINLDFVIFFMGMLAIPAISSYLGYRYLKNEPQKLFALMYCIEVPLFFLTIFRIFFMRELTWGTGFFLSLFGLSALFLGYKLIFEKKTNSSRTIIGSTLLLCCGLWIFFMLFFFIPPMALGLIKVLWSALGTLFSIPLEQFLAVAIWSLIILAMTGAFVFYTATLFVVFPIVYVYTALTNWWAVAKESWPNHRKLFLSYSLATLAVVSSLFAITSHQKHRDTLEKLREAPITAADKKEIVENETFYRAALTDIYLAPYRYLGDVATANAIESLYEDTFGLNWQDTRWMQKVFNSAAFPFVYKGKYGMAVDQKDAEKMYEELFDITIQEAERDKIRHAIQTTYSRQNIEAGLININEKRVHLNRQDLTFKDQGEWADLELHETYFNNESSPEEVFLHLKLPAGAIIDGVWLSDDETKKYTAKVAPRGAAQKVYKEIVKQGADPALVEQVGPQLYRLRVFPVPGNSPQDVERKLMHMWVSFRLLKQTGNAWTLPSLTEKRNLFWDIKTKFTINGIESEKEKEWLPKSLPANATSSPIAISAVIGNKNITAQPFDTTTLPVDCSLAVVIDTSIGMRGNQKEILEAKDAIDKKCNGRGLEYFVWNGGVTKAQADLKAQIESQVFWGSFDPTDLAKNFETLSESKSAVIIITSKSFFREKEKLNDVSKITKSTWFLMIDQQYARSVNDNLLKRLYEVGGGIESDWNSIAVANSRRAYKASQKDILDIDDRYIWKFSNAVKPSQNIGAIHQILTHKFIIHSIQNGFANGNVDLDKLQKMASQSHIVSPYSSMIVLVNEEQQKLLAKASEASSRFDRDVETGNEILSTPDNALNVSAVPEPGEWALIFIVCGFLLYSARKKGYLYLRI